MSFTLCRTVAMNGICSQNVSVGNTPLRGVEGKFQPRHTMDMARKSKLRPEETAEISLRMRAVRRKTGLSQAEFARTYELGKSQWTQIESGERIGLDAAITLVRRFGYTLDWIYLGNPARMPVDEYAELQALVEVIREEVDQKKRAPRPKSATAPGADSSQKPAA